MKYDTDAVIIAAGITTIIVFSLTIFAFQVGQQNIILLFKVWQRIIITNFIYFSAQTKVDFTMMGGMLLCVLVVFMLFGLIAIFLPQSRFSSKSSQNRDILWANINHLRTLHMVWGALGALIFSVYLVYDTQVKSVNVIYFVGSWCAWWLWDFFPLWDLQIFHNLGWAIDRKYNFSRWWLEGTINTRSPPRSTSSQPSPFTLTSSTSSCTSSGPISPSSSRSHLVDGDFPRFVGAARSN